MLEICGRWARVSHIPFVSPLFQFFLVTDSLTVAAAAPAMPRPLNEAQRELHECRVCRRQLRSEGIESKADFRRWARTHHPDKGGSVRHFQHVAHCVGEARVAWLSWASAGGGCNDLSTASRPSWSAGGFLLRSPRDT